MIWVAHELSSQFRGRRNGDNSMRELTLEEIEVVVGGGPIIDV